MPSIKKLFVDAGSMLGNLALRTYSKVSDIFSTVWAWVSNKVFGAKPATAMPETIHTERLGNKGLERSEGTLISMYFLSKDENGKSYFSDTDIINFSKTCQAARRISSDARKEHALESLLTAVAGGNEDLVRKNCYISPRAIT